MAYLTDSGIGSDYSGQIAATQSQSFLSVLKTDMDRDYFQGRMSPESYQFALNLYNKKWADLSGIPPLVTSGANPLIVAGLVEAGQAGQGNQTTGVAGGNQDDVTGLVGAPLAGQGNQQTGVANMTAEEQARQEADLQAQYLNQLGIPSLGTSMFQRWQMQQMNPTLGAYRLQSQAAPDRSFADYMAQSGIMGARAQLPGLYNQMFEARPGVGGGAAIPASEFAEAQRGAAGGWWNDIQQAIAREKYGRFFGPQLAAAIPQMESQWQAGPGLTPGVPADLGFMQYLRQRYGL